ncbi:MAG TPA: hypothetical protein VNI52_08485 [Sphingobacteriaceae bacterium]|nr:hypothetical protein [Sphingobacteriaceae bacterium]
MSEIKRLLLIQCLNYAEERIKNAQDAILSARDAATNDTKSSAGDKYETTREMMQQEISRNQKLLDEAQRIKYSLSTIHSESKSTIAQSGSLVITSEGNFFIAVSAGQITIKEKLFFAISPASPIGSKLSGLQKGDTFKFNGKNFEILEVS